MDALDEKIISLLRVNAREPVTVLARKLSASRSTIQDRITRLENSGVIRGYKLDLEDRATSKQIRAFVTVSAEPQKTALIVAELKTENSVSAIHSVSGKYDLHLEISTNDTEHMDKTLDRISEIPGVIRTETSVVLSTKLKR